MRNSHSHVNHSQAGALEKLKAILLSQERQKIEHLIQEFDELRSLLEDKEKLLNHLDPLTIDLLARRVEKASQELAEVLAPAIGPAIRRQIASAKDDIVDALYPVIGQAIRKAVAEAMKNLARAVNEKLDNALSFRLFRKRVVARLKGISPDAAVLSEVLPFRIHEIFYIHKKSGILLAHASWQTGDSTVKDVISGMLSAIKSFAQDALGTNGSSQDLNVIEYDDYQIYLENGRYAFLAVVISGVPPERFYEQIKNLEARLHKRFAKMLRDFDGNLQPFADIPDELNELMHDFSAEEQKGPKAPLWLKAAVVFLMFGFLAWGIWAIWPHHSSPKRAIARSFDMDHFVTELQMNLPPNLKSDLPRVHFIVEGNLLILDGTIENVNKQLQLALAAARVSGFPVVVNRLHGITEREKALRAIHKTHILFDKGSWQLTVEQKAQLDSLLPYFKLWKEQKILVIGHSDNLGTEKFNRAISHKRAEAVARYLQSQGIPSHRIVVMAKGSSAPYVPNNSKKNRALNRRVCFKLLGKNNDNESRY